MPTKQVNRRQATGDSGNQKASIMDSLMASYDNRKLNFERGEKVTGEIINITDSEIILDLKAKAEGVLNKKELPSEKLENLKVGEKLEVYVAFPENESGQIVLSSYRQENINSRSKTGRKIDFSKWQKFMQGKESGNKFIGEITEINRGGLIVSLDSIRGFIPSSQISLKSLNTNSQINDLIGRELKLNVLEVDPENNKLVFSARPNLSKEEKDKLTSYKVGDIVKGKIQAILPFGLFLAVSETEGIVFPQEISWTVGRDQTQENTDELMKDFKAGEEVEAKITGIDETAGRLNLSIRQMAKDPFEEDVKKFTPDDMVTGLITNITQNGIEVALQSTPGVLGFLPAEKKEGQSYQINQKVNFLVDSIDAKNRKINLVPFLTSTVGLIYK